VKIDLKEQQIAKSDLKVLEKFQRMINLDDVVGNWREKLGLNEGPFDWMKLIN